jgi:hypothetical protein
MATRKNIVEDDQLDEFTSSSHNDVLPEPTSAGTSSRPADQSTGETSYSMSTKAEVLAALMHDLQARGKDELFDIYKAHTSANNSRPADKGNAGETYGSTTHTPTAVKPTFQSTTPHTQAINAKEDVSEIFGGEELSEELMTKAATVYEAAVNSRISIVEARLEEQFTEALQEAIDLVHEEVVESVDKYMSYVAKEWMETNQLSVDNGLKAEMAEELLLSLKETFESNYITVSEEKADVMADMAEEIENLKARLSEEVDIRISLEDKLEESRITDLVAEMTEGMTVSQKEKFISLAENISFSDADEFASKVETIKETYFSGKTISNAAAEPLTEDFNDDAEVKAVPVNMKAYVDSLSRISK